MSQSEITTRMKDKESTVGLKGIDLVNAIRDCVTGSVPIGFYIVGLVTGYKVSMTKGQKTRLTNLVKQGIILWAKQSRWIEVRAYCNMLQALEGETSTQTQG